LLQLLGDFVPQTPYRRVDPRLHWGTTLPQAPWLGPKHVNPLHCKILGTPMHRNGLLRADVALRNYPPTHDELLCFPANRERDQQISNKNNFRPVLSDHHTQRSPSSNRMDDAADKPAVNMHTAVASPSLDTKAIPRNGLMAASDGSKFQPTFSNSGLPPSGWNQMPNITGAVRGSWFVSLIVN